MTEKALVMPFSLDAAGNIRTTSDQESIWATRVRIAISTLLGERVQRPTYGTRVGAYGLDTISSMEEIIQKEVNRVFSQELPLLTLSSVEVTHDEKGNKLTATVLYSLPNKTEITTQVGIMVVSNTNPPYEELV